MRTDVMRTDVARSDVTRRAWAGLVLLPLAVGCASARRAVGPPAAAVASADTPWRGASADSASWRGQPVARIEEVFAGRFPGVDVFAVPGGLSVRIRGATSFRGLAEPLFVVDGLPLTPGSGGLVGINPNDVARIEVLRNAGELAEYGVRGGNGVIRITTKRGR